MKEVNIISKVVSRGKAEALPSASMPNMAGYATMADLQSLKELFDDFLSGDDVDVVINRWKDVEEFLAGISEEFDLLSMLGLKADKADLANYVTIGTEQTITGLKDFTGGLKVNGSPIVYDAVNKYWKLEGDLLVTGGITMFGSESAFKPSTIMDAIATDEVNLKVVDGVLTFVGSSGGGLSEVYWDDVIGRPTLLSSFVDDVVDGHYLPLSGGQMTGNIGYTLERDTTYSIGLPVSGSAYFTDFYSFMQSSKTFIGSIMNSSSGAWFDLISLRHTNGHGDDGVKYGMYIITKLNESDNLSWNKQINGTWQGERVLLDSVNWSNYIQVQGGGSFISTSGGTITNSGTGLYINRTTAGSNPHITYQLQGKSIGDIGVAEHGAPAFYDYAKGAWVDILTQKDPIVSGQLRIDGTTSRGSLPSLKFFINNVNWAQFIMNDTGAVELRDGASQSSTYVNMWLGTLHTFNSPGIIIRRESGVPYIRFTDYNLTTYGEVGVRSTNELVFWKNSSNAWCDVAVCDSSGNLLVKGGITMYSDKRKKTILNNVELTLQQISDAPLIEHYYNSDEKRTTHVGSVAQYWAGMNDWFCKLDSEGYYTMEIQNAALASAISIARELQRYESKTDKKIRLLKKRVSELEDEIEKLKMA